jgi:hypothetical protein
MNLNLYMTYCSDSSQVQCAVADYCQRAVMNAEVTAEVDRRNRPSISIEIFQPKRGEKCEGYLPTKEEA